MKKLIGTISSSLITASQALVIIFSLAMSQSASADERPEISYKGHGVYVRIFQMQPNNTAVEVQNYFHAKSCALLVFCGRDVYSVNSFHSLYPATLHDITENSLRWVETVQYPHHSYVAASINQVLPLQKTKKGFELSGRESVGVFTTVHGIAGTGEAADRVRCEKKADLITCILKVRVSHSSR